MRKVLAAFAAIALLCPSVWAQSQADGPLTTSGDTVTIDALGTRLATVKFRVRSAGTATAAAKVSTDGVNFIAAPYAKRLTTASANPTVQAIATTTLVTGDVWEVPLPANATQFQLACDGTGTTTSVSALPGLPYITGVPVTAVLYDVTESGTGVGLATGTIEFSGWVSAHIVLVTPTTQVWTFRGVDDTGTAVGPTIATTAASSGSLLISQNPGSSGATLGAGIPAAWPFGERRFSLTLPAGGTVSTGRARVVARR
jgi:hypothetical protein